MTTPEAWLRYHQALALSAFVAGMTMAEMMMRLASTPLHSEPLKPRIRLVSSMRGLYLDPDFIKDD